MAEQLSHGRGTDPEDGRFFSAGALPLLREALEETCWLLERGYPTEGVMTLVGNHHQLSARQRLAVLRAACTGAQREGRLKRMLPLSALRDGVLQIDGFNLIITLEVALSGGALVRCRDGVVRDLAGLRGTYRPIDKTDEALTLFGKMAAEQGIPGAVFWLDAPVSNSGRLRAKILDFARLWGFPVEARLVPDPDVVLRRLARVVTGDSAILDQCPSWFNLVPRMLGSIPSARIIDLGAKEG